MRADTARLLEAHGLFVASLQVCMAHCASVSPCCLASLLPAWSLSIRVRRFANLSACHLCALSLVSFPCLSHGAHENARAAQSRCCNMLHPNQIVTVHRDLVARGVSVEREKNTDCLEATAREEEEEEEEEQQQQQQQQQGRAERSAWPSEAQQKQAHICVRAGLQH